jgi:hypothetical protein
MGWPFRFMNRGRIWIGPTELTGNQLFRGTVCEYRATFEINGNEMKSFCYIDAPNDAYSPLEANVTRVLNEQGAIQIAPLIKNVLICLPLTMAVVFLSEFYIRRRTKR